MLLSMLTAASARVSSYPRQLSPARRKADDDGVMHLQSRSRISAPYTRKTPKTNADLLRLALAQLKRERKNDLRLLHWTGATA